MRPYGRAEISISDPRALGVCDRCGFLFNHYKLRWQHDWRGPRIQNIRVLVCESCYDKPQEQLRTIVLPPDPVPIFNPRPENYVAADNPVSGLGFNPRNLTTTVASTMGGNIGNMTYCGGIDSAFNGVNDKPFHMSAAMAVSNSSYQNWVGKNWSGDPANITTPSSLAGDTVTRTISSFTLYAPSDSPFLASGATGYWVQGSNTAATWTTVYSGTTTGTAGEIVTSVSTAFSVTTAFAYHRVVFNGDGTNPMAVAQVVLNVSDGPSPEV